MQCNSIFSKILAANQFLNSDVMSSKIFQSFGNKSIFLAVMRNDSRISQILSANQLF